MANVLTWTRIGKYDVRIDSETKRIYPKNKFGKVIPVTLSNQTLHLRHVQASEVMKQDAFWRTPLGVDVVFKRHSHPAGRRRRNGSTWLWNDSRIKGPVRPHWCVDEVARMLFNGDKHKAIELIVTMIRKDAAMLASFGC